MKFYADKHGSYLGASNCGQKPAEAKYETENAPESAQDVFDSESESWVPAAGLSEPASDQCQGLTKADSMCKHKATHGNYCRQHASQGEA